MLIQELKDKILAGGEISADEAYALCDIAPAYRQELWDAAREITRELCDRLFDSCSIVNARSGKCSENCKWCAQSAHHHTDIETYPLISREHCMRVADMNRRQGIKRFSLVTSGRKMSGKELETACTYYKELKEQGGIELCASMGLLTREELQQLHDSGVTRYHCNLEAGPSHFATLCTTHTIEDKIQTILAAREVGMEVCSGGIIGMGETPRQRVELALELRRVKPHSIPINVLSPIKGTPLENQELISEDEVIDTVALFRFVHPRCTIRFAGGRARLSRETKLRCLSIAFNGGIVGDLLTTLGTTVAEDKAMIAETGYEF